MARADLLVDLIKSGMNRDNKSFRKVVEAVIAEERAKNHTVLANKLEDMLENTPAEKTISNGNSLIDPRMGNLFYEIIPQRHLSDLILPEDVQLICKSLIQEQHRADLLRSYNLEPRNRVLLIGPPGKGIIGDRPQLIEMRNNWGQTTINRNAE